MTFNKAMNPGVFAGKARGTGDAGWLDEVPYSTSSGTTSTAYTLTSALQ